MKNIVLIGGGLTSARTALTLLEQGFKDSITLITDEPYFPYERPGLSKRFLQGREPESSLYTPLIPDVTGTPSITDLVKAPNLHVMINTRVKSIDRDKKVVNTNALQPVSYDKLLIATGAKPRQLTVVTDNSIPVFYLRTIDNAKEIIGKIDQGTKKAVVIGASFIGMEVASSLAQRNIKVTIIHRGDRVFDRLESSELSDKFVQYYKNRGVDFVLNDEANNISKNRITSMKGKQIEADFIIAGIGVEPMTDIALQAGLPVQNGILVNEFLQTPDLAIWAAGDVANFPNPDGKRYRLEHWDNAYTQGAYVAKNMLGDKTRFVHTPYFFSDIFDLSFEFFGDSTLAHQTTVIDHWDQNKKEYMVLYRNAEARLVAAFVMRVSDKVREVIIQAVESKIVVDDQFLKTIA